MNEIHLGKKKYQTTYVYSYFFLSFLSIEFEFFKYL